MVCPLCPFCTLCLRVMAAAGEHAPLLRVAPANNCWSSGIQPTIIHPIPPKYLSISLKLLLSFYTEKKTRLINFMFQNIDFKSPYRTRLTINALKVFWKISCYWQYESILVIQYFYCRSFYRIIMKECMLLMLEWVHRWIHCI